MNTSIEAQSSNAIDYNLIARLASANNIRFETLCKRAEVDGARTEAELLGCTLRQPNEDWLTTPQAAAHLSLSYSSFVGTLMGAELQYYGIRYRSRSRKNPASKRGCGVLFNRRDLDQIIKLRQAIGSNTRTALRVFQATRKGLVTMSFQSEQEQAA